MNVALDVHYSETAVQAACLGFSSPGDGTPTWTLVATWDTPAEPYEPGDFKRRELPYLLELVRAARARHPLEPPSLLIVDGYVWLGEERPGLGHFLFEALQGSVPVLGVAKSRFRGAPAEEVLRGTSRSPLHVTSVGIPLAEAVDFVARMHGSHRLPTLLRQVDQFARGSRP